MPRLPRPLGPRPRAQAAGALGGLASRARPQASPTPARPFLRGRRGRSDSLRGKTANEISLGDRDQRGSLLFGPRGPVSACPRPPPPALTSAPTARLPQRPCGPRRPSVTRGVCTSPSSARGQPPWAPRASTQVWALPGPAVTHTMLWLVTGSPPPAGCGVGTTRRRSRDGRGLGSRAASLLRAGQRTRARARGPPRGAAAPPALAGARWAEAARGGGGL